MPHDLSLKPEFTAKWVTRSKPLKPMFNSKSERFKIVDLFCGCGGLTAGLAEACLSKGVFPHISLAVDLDEDALEVYERNFKKYSEHIVLGDVTSLFPVAEGEDLIKMDLDKVDILVAGPPCQGHSDLNNTTRRNDPRNELYLSCLQAIKVINPNFVLIENVPTVVHSREDVVNRTSKDLEGYGYEVRELIVDFTMLGLAQTRKRHVLLASRKKGILKEINFAGKEDSPAKLIDFIGDLELKESSASPFHCSGKLSDKNKSRVDYLFDFDLFDLPDSQRPNCHKNGNHSYKSNYGRLSYDLPAQTITSGYGSIGQGRYIHPTQRRTITSNEAARIQGFPDDHTFSGIKSTTALRKMIANAVPPQFGYVLAKWLLNLKTTQRYDQLQHAV